MRWYAATHVGHVRERNEDAHGTFALPGPTGGRLFAVADGMGGHRAGDVASALALASLETFLHRWAKARSTVAAPAEMEAALAQGLQEAHRRLVVESSGRTGREGMGTTLTAVHLAGARFSFAHVGDSRLYRWSPGPTLNLLSRDDALVAEMVRAGTLTETEARIHPQRHVLTQALGLDRPPEVQTGSGTLGTGEGLILCSDGLTNMLTDGEIAGLITGAATDADVLVEAANLRGGPDNVTVMMIWWEDTRS